ncbi:hypothetical protein ACSXAL_11975 [Clostridium perfringens]|uniref:hypothetical protein n=1 Tax=Clostridium perfringens TaxID=1502 RepID=UPI002AF6A377|nr:hypothetical protein [Clostridium perfringens]
MKKIYLKKQLGDLSDYPIEVIKSIYETIDILNENYGENRNVDKDLGGYVLIVEGIEGVKVLKNGMLKDIILEYTDEIIYIVKGLIIFLHYFYFLATFQ